MRLGRAAHEAPAYGTDKQRSWIKRAMKEANMQVYIDGQHTDVSPALHEWIAQQLEALNSPHNDILHARVTLEKQQHHLRGADEARMVFQLPGKTLTAMKTGKTLDEALNKAMDVMTRELHDFRTQRRQVVKEPGPQVYGRIVRLFPERGYGFIETEAQREVYFHAHAVHGINFADLRPGMVVALDVEAGEQGPQATRLTPHR